MAYDFGLGNVYSLFKQLDVDGNGKITESGNFNFRIVNIFVFISFLFT